MAVLALGPDSSEQNIDNLATTGKPSVAVLPLDYISDDESQAFLADAIAEDVITLLSRNPRFFVIARNSSFTYKGQAVDIRQVGEELGVRYVVEGSVRKTGEQLRVTVQLIDSTNGQHLWAEQYDRPFAEIYDLQDEITNGIAAALGDEIFTAEIARAYATPGDNLDAWGLVMRANRMQQGFNRESSIAAISSIRDALDLDPDYTLAKSELARMLCIGAVNNYSDNPARDIAEAYILGEAALQSAPNDPMALLALGSCYSFSGRGEEGIRLLEKAISKQPNDAFVLTMLGLALTRNGDPTRGLSYFYQALLISPKSPSLYFVETFRAAALNELKRHTEAEQAANNALKSYGGYSATWIHLAVARAGQGNKEGAIQALYNGRKVDPKVSLERAKAVFTLVDLNKGKTIFSLLEPIWPEDLLTTE
ncbi:MAG: tetratricopeptide repeat protein [Porticoccaceae bacterium]|nr:tetratricopeptide repeat protein [Porticoccaceae bacterium]